MNGFVRRGLVVGVVALLGCGAKDAKKGSQAPAEVSCKATDAERARVALSSLPGSAGAAVRLRLHA